MTAVASPVRLAGIDRARGLAVLLMVLDHALVVLDSNNPARLTVTRLALPLFMICAATVWKGRPSRRRALALAAVGALDLFLAPLVGLGSPAPVAGFCLLVALLVAAPTLLRWPLVACVLGFVQGFFIPLGWQGWELGVLLGWFMVGRLGLASGQQEIRRIGDRLPAFLAVIGRRPLIWYVGHLVGMLGLAAL